MPDDPALLRLDIERIQKQLDEERIRREVNFFWFKIAGAALVAWMGLTSFWHIPKAIRDSSTWLVAEETKKARDQAVHAAALASDSAKRAAADADKIASLLAKYQGMTVRLREVESNGEIGLTKEVFNSKDGQGAGLMRLPADKSGVRFKVIFE